MRRKKSPKNKELTGEVLARFVAAGEFASHFRVSPATVTTWLEAGMPCVKRGKTRRGVLIDRVEADPWVAQHRGAEKASSAKTSVAHEQAERLRIANARARRELITAQEVQAVFHESAAVLVQSCDAMPQRVSADVAIQAKVRDECNALRSAFARRLEALAGDAGDLSLDRGNSPAASTTLGS